MDVKEQIALSILKGAGGDVDKDYTSTSEIYRDVESIYRSQDNRQDVDPLQVELIDNGTYTYDDRNTQGYKPVEINVNVPVEDYYNSGFENGIVIQKAKLEAITITENGIYNKEDGYDEVEVNIDTQSYYDNGYNNGYNEGVDNGIQEQKSKLESITIESNGTYIKEDGYNEVKVALDIPKTNIYNGFRFVSEGNNDYKRIKDIDFSQYDWSGVYSMKSFFGDFKSTDGGGLISSDFDNFIENFNGSFTSCGYMFQGSNALLEAPNFGDRTENCIDMTRMFYNCGKLVSVPPLNTSNVVYANNMFEGCVKLTSIPQLDTSNVINMQYMFSGCPKLTSIPQLNTSNVRDMMYMFNGCASLTSIPQLNTSNVTNMEFMFYDCSKLTTIPQLNTSNVTNMYHTFSGCSKLTTIPQLDTSNVTNMESMFNRCTSLITIPQLNTSNVTNMESMFNRCTSLITIPQLNTSNVQRLSQTFAGCTSLQSIPLLDCQNVNAISMFGYSNINSVTDLGGFKDLGKQSIVNGINGDLFSRVPNLTHESLVNIINNLYDRKSNGLSVITVSFGTSHLNKLSDEEKAIAINKGWNLS